MIALFLLAAPAHAGLLDALDEQGRHLAACQQAAADAEEVNDYHRASGVWEACLAEASRRGFTEIEGGLKAQIAVEHAEEVAAPRREKDPHHAAMEVLAVAARYSGADLPTDIVTRTFRAWMQTDEGRAYVEQVRTVSVNWEGTPDARVDAVLRRAVEDAGLKWTSPGDPTADTIVSARAEHVRTAGASTAEGELAHVETRLVVTRVRVRARDATLKGFTASASAESPTELEAGEASLKVAAEAAAHTLLQRLLGVLFPEG